MAGLPPVSPLHPEADATGDHRLDAADAAFALRDLVRTLQTATLEISGFSPASGPVGTEVTINGRNFPAGPDLAGEFLVLFGDVPAAGARVEDGATIVVTVPAAATSGAIVVVTPGGEARSAIPFSVIAGADVDFTPPAGMDTGQYRFVAPSGATVPGRFGQAVAVPVRSDRVDLVAALPPCQVPSDHRSPQRLPAGLGAGRGQNRLCFRPRRQPGDLCHGQRRLQPRPGYSHAGGHRQLPPLLGAGRQTHRLHPGAVGRQS
ncbi:MAG TPA: hypothetical protein ENJ73_01500, partial [Desulfobacterales bacterium]|nr:hypothetical protein [Desulfobacterales bacterium]